MHYRKSNHIGGKKTPTYNDIQNIILTQRGKLLSNIAKFSSAGADIKDVERILREFSTDGQIGQKIYQELNSRSLSREAAISNGESSIFKTSSDFFSAATPQITSDMTRTIDYINDNLNRMIVEIAKGTPSFALAIVQNYYGKGADNIPSIVKAYIPSNCTISQKDLQDAANVNKHLSNIKAAMNLENVTVDAVIKAVEKNINQISGSFYEQAVNYSFNTIGQKALKQTAKEVNQAFKSAKFASTWTGDILALNEDGKTSSGKKVKGDITVEYNEGGIVYRFGGSIKLRNGDGYLGGKKNWLTNLSPRSRTLLTGINDLVSAGALSAQYGEALLGFRSADVSNAT